MMQYLYDDGGRSEAGYKGSTGDCTIRAIAIAAGLPYQTVYDQVNLTAKRERPRRGRTRSNSRTGVHKQTYRRYLEGLGWRWIATMGIGTGCRVHLRRDELPSGRLVVSLSRHLTAVIDGVIHDTFNPDRGGTRCVYGYFVAPENPQKVGE